MSDPLISLICLKRRVEKRKRVQLPREVLNMLCTPEASEELSESEDDYEDSLDTLLSYTYEN